MHIYPVLLAIMALISTNCTAVKKNKQAPLPPLEDKTRVENQQPLSKPPKNELPGKTIFTGDFEAYLNIKKIRFAYKNELSSCGLDACVLLVVDEQKLPPGPSLMGHLDEMMKGFHGLNKFIDLVEEGTNNSYTGILTGVGADQSSPAWTVQFRQIKQAELDHDQKYHLKYSTAPASNESNLVFPDEGNVEF